MRFRKHLRTEITFLIIVSKKYITSLYHNQFYQNQLYLQSILTTLIQTRTCGISVGWSFLVSPFSRIRGAVLASWDEECYALSWVLLGLQTTRSSYLSTSESYLLIDWPWSNQWRKHLQLWNIFRSSTITCDRFNNWFSSEVLLLLLVGFAEFKVSEKSLVLVFIL